MHNDPVKNYKFAVTIDGTYNVGVMSVIGLAAGESGILLQRGITNTPDDRVFHDWLLDAPNRIAIGVEGRVIFHLTNIEIVHLNFSELDAGANALLLQQLSLRADVKVSYH